MKLAYKLTLLFMLLTITSLVTVGYLAYTNGRKTIEHNTRAHLSEITRLKEADLSRWVANSQIRLGSLAQRPLIREYAATLSSTASADPAFQAARKKLLNDHFEPALAADSSFLVLSILRPDDGLVLVSTEKTLEGAYQDQEQFFVAGKQGPYIESPDYSLAHQGPVMHASTPIMESGGRLLGVLVVHLDLNEMSKIMRSGDTPDVTQETYLVNAFHFPVTETALQPGWLLTKTVSTTGVNNCLAQQDGTGFYTDYRGVPVIGAYRWMPDLKLCIITEIDQADALKPIVDLRNALLVIGAIVALGAALLAALFARTITRPLHWAVEGAGAIGRGALDYRIRVTSQDEIGELARAFNEMAGNLQHSLGETAHRQDLLLALSEAAQAVQRARTPKDVYHMMGSEIAKLDLHTMVFALTDDRDYLQIDYHTFDSNAMREAEKLAGFTALGYRFKLETGSIYDRVFREETAIYFDRLGKEILYTIPEPARPLMEHIAYELRLEQSIYVPLSLESTVFGVLLVTGTGLSAADLPAITTFASQAATALDNTRLYEEVRHHAENLERLVDERTAELQQEKRLSDDIINGLPGVFYMFDESGMLVRWNKQFERVTDYSVDELASKLAADFFEGDHKARIMGLIQTVFVKDRADAEADFVSKSGRKAPYYFTGVRISLDANTYLMGVGIDITERVHGERKSAELAAIVQSSDDAIIGKGIDGVITSWNEGARRIYGYSESEVIGQPITMLAPPGHADEITRFLDKLKRGEHIENYETVRRRKNGDLFPASVTVSPVRDAEGRVIAASTIGRDITERKRIEDALRASEERFRAVFEKSTAGYSLTTPDGRLMEINTAFADMLGYNVEDLLHIDFAAITYPDDIRESLECIRCLLAGERNTYRMEKRYIHRDGYLVWAIVSTTLLRNEHGDPLFFITNIQDITTRKQYEETLQELNEDLTRSNTELEQFAYVASHDLQEPLRTVISYLQLLERRYADRLDSNANEFIDFAVDGAMRMKALINDLLTFSRVGTRGQVFEPADIEGILDQVLGDLQVMIGETQAVITHDRLPSLTCDKQQIGQLLQNLIGNGLKFRRDAPPYIHIGAAFQDQSKEWIFSVSDNGIGIDPEYFDRIFIIFQRLHGKQDYPGTGIGLALCKKIVQRHGGRIWVESQSGQGSTFFFSLPEKENFGRTAN